MSPTSPETPESRHQKHIQVLSDTAETLSTTLDLKRNPTIHISRALAGIPEGKERDRLFGEIRRELEKRNRDALVLRTQEQEEHDELEEARSRLERNNMMRDAYAHQMRQPRDTWDPTSDEENETL
jgi:uncharacterized protein involved in exopolysaccharide biosynthesis